MASERFGGNSTIDAQQFLDLIDHMYQGVDCIFFKKASEDWFPLFDDLILEYPLS